MFLEVFRRVFTHKNCLELTFFESEFAWKCGFFDSFLLFNGCEFFCFLELYCSWVLLKFLFFEFFFPWVVLKFFALGDFWLLGGLKFFAHKLFVKFPSSLPPQIALHTTHAHWEMFWASTKMLRECANLFIHSQQLWFLHATRPFCCMTIGECFAWITFFIHGFNKRFCKLVIECVCMVSDGDALTILNTLLGGMHPNP